MRPVLRRVPVDGRSLQALAREELGTRLNSVSCGSLHRLVGLPDAAPRVSVGARLRPWGPGLSYDVSGTEWLTLPCRSSQAAAATEPEIDFDV